MVLGIWQITANSPIHQRNILARDFTLILTVHLHLHLHLQAKFAGTTVGVVAGKSLLGDIMRSSHVDLGSTAIGIRRESTKMTEDYIQEIGM